MSLNKKKEKCFKHGMLSLRAIRKQKSERSLCCQKMIYAPPDGGGTNDVKSESAGSGEGLTVQPSKDNSQVSEQPSKDNADSATFDIERVPSMPPAKVDPYKAGMVKVTVPKGGVPGTVLAFTYQKSELRCVVPDGVDAGRRFVVIVNQQLVNNSKKLVLFSPIMVNLMTFTPQFLATLDQSILDVSLVSIADQLGVSLTEAQWILLAYFLCCSCFLPFAGKLGDRFSRTLVLQVGQILFLAGSIGCALSIYGGFEMLIAFRCIQGVGASCMMANTLSMITYFTELKTRDMAIGYNIVVVGVALSLGPVVGGLITEYLGWPVCFLINIPVGLMGIVAVFLYVPHTPRNPNVNLDWFAGILFFVMAGSALLGFTLLADENNVPAAICLCTALLAIAGLAVWHACRPNPLVPKSVLKNPVAMGSYAITLLFFYAVAVLRFQLPTVLQRGRSALTVSQTGLVLLAQPIGMIFGGPLAGFATSKLPHASHAGLLGALVYLTGYATLSMSWLSLPAVVVVVSLMSLGMIFVNVPTNQMLMNSVEKEHYSIAGGLVSTARTISLPLGIATLNFAMKSFYRVLADPQQQHRANHTDTTRVGRCSNATQGRDCIEDIDAYMLAARYSTMLMLVPCALLLALSFCRLRCPKTTEDPEGAPTTEDDAHAQSKS